MSVNAIVQSMLTRSGVAKKLRCSLATVRRLESKELFPERDARGVHWFNEQEVARVQLRLARGRTPAAQGSWLATAGPERRGSKFGPRAVARIPRAARGTTSVASARRAAAIELDRENERLRKENAELQARLGALVDGVEALLKHGPRDQVLELLQAACSDLD